METKDFFEKVKSVLNKKQRKGLIYSIQIGNDTPMTSKLYRDGLASPVTSVSGEYLYAGEKDVELSECRRELDALESQVFKSK